MENKIVREVNEIATSTTVDFDNFNKWVAEIGNILVPPVSLKTLPVVSDAPHNLPKFPSESGESSIDFDGSFDTT